MYEYPINKFNALMYQLSTLPAKIAEAEKAERDFVNSVPDGWAGLGKNDTQRQLAVDTATYGALSDLKGELSAAKYAADLLSSMLKFMSANGFNAEFNTLGQDEAEDDLRESFSITNEELPDIIFNGL